MVVSLEHLRIGGELHSPAASPAHPHSPHVNQMRTHGTAHGVSKQWRGQITQICTVTLYKNAGLRVNSDLLTNTLGRCRQDLRHININHFHALS